MEASCIHVDQNQLDRLHHLKSYPPILYLSFVATQQALHDFKTSTILVDMILNRSTACGQHGYSLLPFLFNRSSHTAGLFLIKKICSSFKFFFVCFVVCVYHSCSGGEKDDSIKCRLIVGGSPRYSNTFSNFFLLLLYTHTNQHMLCIVTIVDCSHYRSATATFKDLVTLQRRTLQRIL